MHKIINQIIAIFNNPINFIVFFYPFFKAPPNGEYSNSTFSTTPGLYPKYSPVKYSCLSNYLDDNAEILAASLSISY